MASNAVPDMYSVQILDNDGNRMPDLELLCSQYHANFRRTNIKNIFNLQFRYGTCFTYVGNKENEKPTNIFNIHPKYIKPVIKDGDIDSWEYSGGNTTVTIPKEDILIFSHDAVEGEVYGKSMLGPIVQTLHLLLNTELNIAEIVDKYAIPLVHWLVESDEENQQLSDNELSALVSSIQNQYEYGNDVITDARITTDVIASGQGQYDLAAILKALKQSMGILTVPFQLLGGDADNLSAIKVQVAQYLNDLQNYQLGVSDALIEQFYKPFLESQGKVLGEDYLNIYLVFPVLSAEANADAASWIFPAIKYGLISRDEARAQLGFRGKALEIDMLEFIDSSNTDLINQNIQQSGTQPDAKSNDTVPRNKSGKGDPQDKKDTKSQE